MDKIYIPSLKRKIKVADYSFAKENKNKSNNK